MKLLKAFEELPTDLINNFRKTGKSAAISPQIKKYILELDRAAEIFNVDNEHNISRAAKRLQETFPYMAHATARNRIYDAINYFHLNSTVKEEAWNNYYADRMEDMAKYALSHDNLTEARRCMEKAREYRQHALINSIDPDDFKPHIYFVSPEVDAKLLNLPEFDLKKLWKDTKELINQLPIDSRNKTEAMKDASGALNIDAEDTDYEDV